MSKAFVCKKCGHNKGDHISSHGDYKRKPINDCEWLDCDCDGYEFGEIVNSVKPKSPVLETFIQADTYEPIETESTEKHKKRKMRLKSKISNPTSVLTQNNNDEIKIDEYLKKKHWLKKKHLVGIQIDGETVCSCGCGHVLESKLYDPSQYDMGKESTSIHNKMENHFMHDNGLGSILSIHDYEKRTTVFDVKQLNKLNSLARRKPESQILRNYLKRIQYIKGQLNLSDAVTLQIAHYLKLASRKNILKSKRMDQMLVAMIYVFAKQGGVHISTKLMNSIIPSRHHTLIKYSNQIKETFGIKDDHLESSRMAYLKIIMEHHHTDAKTRMMCISFMNYLDNPNPNMVISGKSPHGIACAVYNLVNNEFGRIKVPLYELKNISHVGEHTLISTRKIIKPFFETFVNAERLKKAVERARGISA